MKATINTTEKQVSNKVVTNKVSIESKKIDLLKAVKVEKTAKVKIASNYKENVLDVNTKLKKEMNSLGACLSLIALHKSSLNLCEEFQLLLKKIASDDKEESKQAYDTLKVVVRTSKSGKYGVFYTLQGMQKVCFAPTKK